MHPAHHLRALHRTLREAGLRLRYGRFHRLKRAANGMLTPAVYRELYRLVRSLPDFDVIEVGAAGGAGSIALALGLREAERRSHVLVVEKFEGGSRDEVGDRATNLRKFERVCREFGVRETIRLFPENLSFGNGAQVLELVDGDSISCLVHDADGRIDRDFHLFWPLLVEGGAIVIDDYENRTTFRPVCPRHPFGGTKKLKTYRLANRLIEWGLLEPRRVLGSTLFGVKPSGATMQRFDLNELQRIVDGVMAEQRAWERAHPDARKAE